MRSKKFTLTLDKAEIRERDLPCGYSVDDYINNLRYSFEDERCRVKVIDSSIPILKRFKTKIRKFFQKFQRESVEYIVL